MVSKCCDAPTAISNNSEWCTNCGTQVRAQCQWVVGYNNPNCYRQRYPVYSRTKRFRSYIINLQETAILTNFNDVMDCFGLLEFHWGNKGCKNRKYFFNKSCVLYFVLKVLDVPVEIKTLKDKSRVESQVRAMQYLLGNWDK